MSALTKDWIATDTQKQNAQRFEAWLYNYMLSVEANRRLWDHRDDSNKQAFVDSLRRAKLAPDAVQLERLVTDYFCHPLLQQLIPNERHAFDPWKARASVSYEWLEYALLQIGGDYAFDTLLARLQFQLCNPRWTKEKAFQPEWIQTHKKAIKALHPMLASEELRGLSRIGQLISNVFLAPDPSTLGLLALQVAQSPAQAQRWLEVVFDANLPIIAPGYQEVEGVDHWPCPYPMSSAVYLRVGDAGDDIASALQKHQLLDNKRVFQLLELEPPRKGYLLNACLNSDEPFSVYADQAIEHIRALTRLPAEIGLAMLGDRADRLGVGSARLYGGEFLVAAARMISELTDPPPHYAVTRTMSDERLEMQAAALCWLCNLKALAPNETAETVAQQLQAFPSARLEALVTHAGPQAGTVLIALGLAEAVPLWKALAESERQDANAYIDRQSWLSAYTLAGKRAEPALKMMRTSKRFARSLKRLDALQGKVEKRFNGYVQQLAQEYLRCLDLLPIDGPSQLHERFNVLQQAIKDASKQFGNERAQNVRDAAACGLENLARAAGFGDATELEWSLETSLNQQPLSVEYDDYTVALELQRFAPMLHTHKAGKPLKALPPALKKVPDIAALLQHFQAFKEQSRRFKTALENAMISGRIWNRMRLGEMLGLPMLASMLKNLVLMTSTGTQGLLANSHSGELRLADVTGQQHTIDESLRLAHVFDLLRAGSLSAWQQHLVNAQMVQPFKQVFRECYVLTPAEREAKTRSARFANRRVVARIASALFTARGWRLEGSESEWVAEKKFSDASGSGLIRIDLPDVYHYLSEDEHTQLGYVEGFRDADGGSALVDLERLPPTVFSEAMRDLDLIITAGAADGDESSAETQERRIELVQKLIPTLGLRNVRIEGQFAFIDGKRANYRLHLGTAVIHLQPAGYLCIVPADKVPARDFSLPFVDEDRRTSEVLSKLVMLSADHLIKDKSILAQILHEGRE
jgi:Domain of unknown function (DUF4132)/Family of unknown function (DUF5724)